MNHLIDFEAAEEDSNPSGWRLYFPIDDIDDVLSAHPWMEEMLEIARGIVREQILSGLLARMRSLYLSASSSVESLGNAAWDQVRDIPSSCTSCFIEFDPLLKSLLEANHALHLFQENPELVINCLNLAAYQSVQEALAEWGIEKSPPKIVVRLTRYSTRITIRAIQANKIGKFVQVQGTIIRVSAARPLVVCMDFFCRKCNQKVRRYFEDGKYNPPSRCRAGGGCRSADFIPDRTSTVTVDYQAVKIQEELVENDGSGRVPQTFDCEMTEDLVESCVPGERVTLCGIVCSMEMQTRGANRNNQTVHNLFLRIHSVTKMDTDDKQSSVLGKTLSRKDKQLISTIASRDDVFKMLVNSLCPAIYGEELVKAGLILALFGGCRQYVDADDKVPIRGDPHVLIVGDPGLGKSKMLSATVRCAPRGVYVCGSYATTAGLTVTVHKEKGSHDYSIEAGALLLADMGICGIDEFDKMSDQHSSLLEAMEQQAVSVAKAGIVCTLPARTSVIAAANPVGGHYNHSKTVCENLRISPAMLSRFDLVFILLDKPNEEKDRILASHVLASHGAGLSDDPNRGYDMYDASLPLRERLRASEQYKRTNNLAEPLMKKYISYARKYVQPELTIEAAKLLQEFYLDLRRNYKTADSTPITTRQLESLQRLAQARAKVELSPYISVQHASDVIELMKQSIFQSVQDEFGFVDFRRAGGMSNAKEIKRFVSALRRKTFETGTDEFTLDELREVANGLNLNIQSFRDFIDSVNYQNYLLKQGNRSYRLCI